MRNHDEKIKDMVESVLPSTRRKAARNERRRAHKQQRSRQRDVLANITAEPDPDFREARQAAAISNMVWDRRAADNVGALVRWAEATVEKDADLRDAGWAGQRAWFASVLPDNTIGRHALQHIEWAIGPGRRTRGCGGRLLGRSPRSAPSSRLTCAGSWRPAVTPSSTSASGGSTPWTAHLAGSVSPTGCAPSGCSPACTTSTHSLMRSSATRM